MSKINQHIKPKSCCPYNCGRYNCKVKLGGRIRKTQNSQEKKMNNQESVQSDVGAVSVMYVNEDGFLMVGPDGKSTSIVDGIRCEWADTDTLELLIQPINDLGGICGTYYR